MNVSHLNTQKINDAGNLCQDPDTKGFDLQAGQSWIYPTNYPVREYQYNITHEALHKNTLVSLPTGLGKTFIAAVVMYNFYRWYPYDKVIFMAPTRPLVKQQMDACYNIMAIPQDATAELTGTKGQQSRSEIWQNKRVFFITPQVLQNDLNIILELGSKIKCLVFDEAHKAKGNHAYCEVIRKLLPKNKLFRVLALSATPGNSSKDVLDVMRNLLIARLEFRSEDSPDVKPYVFERALETVVVPLGEKLQQIKDQYVQILEKYTRTLMNYKVIYGNCGNFTKGKIFMVMKEFQAKNSSSRSPNYAEIMKSLNICVTLYHAYETLIRCGLRAFLNFYKEHINNPLLRGNTSIIEIMNDLEEYLGPDPEVQPLPDGTFGEIPATIKFGHPKFYQLRDILVVHFKKSDTSTRVIVFFEYRESATEAYALLTKSHPVIKARVFVGQGSGVTQKDQINTVKAFRDGTCNTLLSTCIGEEGLDVGEVDLIVCFDIANKSPIRMIQRMGRTGRKKDGRVVILVTEGKEQQTLKDCLIYKGNLGNFATNSELLQQGIYADNPKMIPSYVQPKCTKMYITVTRPVVTKNNNLKDMLRKLSDGPRLDDVEVVEIQERIKDKPENLWNESRNYFQEKPETSKIHFAKHLEKHRVFQDKGVIKRSKQTEIFVSLLQFADSKRYNLPVIQRPIFNNFNQYKCLKQGDIKSMFTKQSTSSLSQGLPFSQLTNYEKEKNIIQSFPPGLFEELSTYLLIESSKVYSCNMCDLFFECPKIDYRIPQKCVDLSTLVVPSLSILDNITVKDLEVFAESLTSKCRDLYKEQLEADKDFFDNIELSKLEGEILGQQAPEESLTDETPRNFDSILDSFRICENEEEPQNVAEKSYMFERPKSFAKILNSLDRSADLDDPEIVSSNNLQKGKIKSHLPESEKSVESYKQILSFFKLSSLEEMFEDSESKVKNLDEIIIYTPKKSEVLIERTPDIIEQSPDLFSSDEKILDHSLLREDAGSPILCSYERVQQLQAKKKLFNEYKPKEKEVAEKSNLANLNQPRKSFFKSPRNKTINPKKSVTSMDVSDLCCLSQFGLNQEILGSKENNEKSENTKKVQTDLDISDVCDLSIFRSEKYEKTKNNQDENNKICLDVESTRVEKISSNNTKESEVTKNEEFAKSRNTNSEKDLTVDDLCDMSQFFSEICTDKEKETESQATYESIEKHVADHEDFCDFSYFLSSPSKVFQKENGDTSLNQTTENVIATSSLKPPLNSTQSKITEKVERVTVIDLTDSDFETTPVKRTSKNNGKIPSQLSITQMLGLISKTDLQSQKENVTSTPKTQRIQKNNSCRSNESNVVQDKQLDTPKRSQTKNKTLLVKNKFNKSLPVDSDDDFEETIKTPVISKMKRVSVKRNEAEKSSVSKEIKKKRKKNCEFLDEEAVLSDDERVVISSDEDSGEDYFEASFVTDETQDFFNSTQMHAKYLQSVKSPARGKFKIPAKPRFNVSNVFSQEVNDEDNNYLNDSFCVSSQEVENSKNHDLSELELLEMQLKEERKNKKRKKSSEKGNTKRRRVLVISDDSD